MTSQATKAAGDVVSLRTVRNARDLRQFINLPYRLYKGDAYWVPPLRISQRDILNTRKHPFYRTSDVEMLLAVVEGRVAGRIMAILNHAHNDFHGERAGFFGFFESERRQEIATRLFEAAAQWLRSKGAEVIRGPFNPSTNYECGLLVEGFDAPPRIMCTYNPPWYAELVEACGFRKAMDLYAYDISNDYFIHSDKLSRVAERLKKKDRITVRTVNLKNFAEEVQVIRRVYNDAWSKNWGFVPVSEEEFDHLAKDLKQLVDPRVVMIAEQETTDGSRQPIGFFLAVPDINIALKRVRDGRLMPFGLLKLLWYSRKINFIRIITMGIVRSHQSLGAGSILLSEIHERGPAAGYPDGEMSWVLESNTMMIRAAEMIGGRLSKTYRIYEKSIEVV
jgi:GNAT superfamily N-acetyltransferase